MLRILELLFSPADMLENSQTRAMRELLELTSEPRPLMRTPDRNGEEESDLERARR